MEQSYSDVGGELLETLDRSQNFVNWMYSQIRPYLYGNLLEVGSGIGTYSKKIIRDFPDKKIILSDIDKKHLEILKTRFTSKNVTVKKVDLNKASDLNIKKINSVFGLNVLEHVEHDVTALKNVYDLLEKGGRAIFLVPAHKVLFNPIDKEMGHYRRYTKKEIIYKVSKTKFKLRKLFYFNCFSIPGWYISGNILKKNTINATSMKLLDTIAPYLRLLEKHIINKKMGISLIMVLEK
ncbi:MAG: class I SAM-dependent methyltransferase [archaeon]